MSSEGTKSKVVDYFKKNISRGYSSVSLKWALIQQGYSRILVENALEKAKKELSEEEKTKEYKEKPKITYQLYGVDNKPIKIPLWRKIKDFFNLS